MRGKLDQALSEQLSGGNVTATVTGLDDVMADMLTRPGEVLVSGIRGLRAVAREEIFAGTPSELEAHVERMTGGKVDTETGEIFPPENELTLEGVIESVTEDLVTLESDIALLRERRADLRGRLKEAGVNLKAFDAVRKELVWHYEERLDAYRTQCSIVRRVLRVPEQMELLT